MLNIKYTYTHVHNKKASRKIFLGTLFFNTVYVLPEKKFYHRINVEISL